MNQLGRPQRKSSIILLSMICLILSSLYSPSFAEESFAVVINISNPFKSQRHNAISVITRLYLKKGKMWPDSDITCRAFDRYATSAEHKQFVEHILQMNEGRLSEHWAKMKQLRGDTSPRKIKTTRILLKLIQKNPGAFGIVNRKETVDLPKGIRVLFYF